MYEDKQKLYKKNKGNEKRQAGHEKAGAEPFQYTADWTAAPAEKASAVYLTSEASDTAFPSKVRSLSLHGFNL